MFKRKKKTGCETPKFRKPTAPPQPSIPTMPPVKPLKTNPPNVGSSVQKPKQPCTYETPCGWCTKWDKECDNKLYTASERLARESAIKKILHINSECDHEWIWSGTSEKTDTYICKKCNEIKIEPKPTASF